VSATWITIVFAGLGTYAMRASFLAFAHRMATVPPGVQRLLRQIPPAALASIVVPAIVRPHGHLGFHAELAAGALATAVAWKTRNTALTLVVGMGALMALRAF
jgi:branched-subunit amino acid transport protein